VTPPLVLRAATDADREFCEMLSRDNMAAYRAARGDAWDRRRYESSWAQFENFVIVAEGERVGALRLFELPTALEIRDLQVAPGRTGVGIGRWAIAQAETAARSRGLPELRLRVFVDNAALRLYERVGFRTDRIVEGIAHMSLRLVRTPFAIAPADPASADARACIAAYLRELSQRFPEGFDASRGPSAEAEELVPPRGVLLLARRDGAAVGCGALKVIDGGVGEIKRMWIAQPARGLGIAQRMLEALEAQARAMALHTIRLDTHRVLVEARALYARNGYVEIHAYNANPYAHHWFEKVLP
jgi:GNAT superfamily N-acetyltransferase